MVDKKSQDTNSNTDPLDVASRVLKRSAIAYDMVTLGGGIASFVKGAQEGGLTREEALELAGYLIGDLVDSAMNPWNGEITGEEE